jgi:uncharacterized damage-inducible protein DinB
MVDVPEPWLRGPIAGVDPCIAPILYTFQQAREDLDLYAGRLTSAQLWDKPYGFGSVGFHLLHIAGSTDRLMSYLEGRALTREQFAALAAEEKTEGLSAAELLAGMDRVFAAAEAVVWAIDPATLSEPRWVGRKRLPTTVAGLLTHTAEHIQRHVGQAISAAKLAQAIGSSSQS